MCAWNMVNAIQMDTRKNEYGHFIYSLHYTNQKHECCHFLYVFTVYKKTNVKLFEYEEVAHM